MIYPIVLVCIAAAILIFLVTFALPKVAGVFTQSGINPPWFSQVVFTVGLFIGANILIISLRVPSSASLIWVVVKTRCGKKTFNQYMINLPLVRTSITSLRSTHGLHDELAHARGIADRADDHHRRRDGRNRRYRTALLRIANDGLSKGLTIGKGSDAKRIPENGLEPRRHLGEGRTPR